jgi:hypothetical protein
MDETARQIEAHIERTRARLGSDLSELGTRLDAATDWRAHVSQRPYLWMGAAVAGGVVLAQLARPSRAPRRVPMALPAAGAVPRRQRISAAKEANDLWETLATAMIGLAVTRVKTYISELVPGFTDELRRAESRRASAADTWRSPVAPASAGSAAVGQ